MQTPSLLYQKLRSPPDPLHGGEVEKLTEQRIHFEIDMCIGCDRCMSACPIPMSTLVTIADLNTASIAQNIPSGWTLQYLISRLREQHFLSDLHSVPENFLLHIIAASRIRFLAPGEISIRESDYGRDLLIIIEGRLALFADEMEDTTYPIAILKNGEHVGEDGVLTSLPYKVTARAQVPTIVLQVPEQVLQRLMELVPDVQRYFDLVNNARSLKSILKRMSLFQDVSDADIHSLIRQTPIKQYDRDEPLFAENDHGRLFTLFLKDL